MEINKEFKNIYTGAEITILKSYWYNGEGLKPKSLVIYLMGLK